MVILYNHRAQELQKALAAARKKRRRQLLWAGFWLLLYLAFCASLFVFVP